MAADNSAVPLQEKHNFVHITIENSIFNCITISNKCSLGEHKNYIIKKKKTF